MFFVADSHNTHPLYSSANHDFHSIIHENLFECNYLMHKFTKKMQVLDGFGFQKRARQLSTKAALPFLFIRAENCVDALGRALRLV